jgi:hypothetical protein
MHKLALPDANTPQSLFLLWAQDTVKTLILRRMIRLNVLALNYWCSTLCQNIGVGKFALELVFLRYADM